MYTSCTMSNIHPYTLARRRFSVKHFKLYTHSVTDVTISRRGYTRGDTHTRMRSTTHYVRSNTPGNNLSFVFSGMSCINSKLRHQLRVRYECDDPMSPVTTVSHHHHHICLPVPESITPRALFLPASHPRYGRQGPRERSQAPSGESPPVQPRIC